MSTDTGHDQICMFERIISDLTQVKARIPLERIAIATALHKSRIRERSRLPNISPAGGTDKQHASSKMQALRS
jgi:hypothetical protein